MNEDAAPPVVSFIVESDYGWITATSPNTNLLLGYVWETKSMHGIHMWRKTANRKPFVRGLEFGTTGLHRKAAELIEQGYIDVSSHVYVDLVVDFPLGKFWSWSNIAMTRSL